MKKKNNDKNNKPDYGFGFGGIIKAIDAATEMVNSMIETIDETSKRISEIAEEAKEKKHNEH